jgi:hypothetical protein
VACRVLGVSRSGYYEARERPPSPRAVADAALTATIRAGPQVERLDAHRQKLVKSRRSLPRDLRG